MGPDLVWDEPPVDIGDAEEDEEAGEAACEPGPLASRALLATAAKRPGSLAGAAASSKILVTLPLSGGGPRQGD